MQWYLINNSLGSCLAPRTGGVKGLEGCEALCRLLRSLLAAAYFRLSHCVACLTN